MNLLVLHIEIWVRGYLRSRNDSKTAPSSKGHLGLGDSSCELEGVVPLLGSSAGLCFLWAAQLVCLSAVLAAYVHLRLKGLENFVGFRKLKSYLLPKFKELPCTVECFTSL